MGYTIPANLYPIPQKNVAAARQGDQMNLKSRHQLSILYYKATMETMPIYNKQNNKRNTKPNDTVLCCRPTQRNIKQLRINKDTARLRKDYKQLIAQTKKKNSYSIPFTLPKLLKTTKTLGVYPYGQ